MESTTGLRERKKAATRQALHDAALRLTLEHGLDRVTIEAIADAAGVSRRTFSNYFDGKEDALLYGDEERMRQLLAAFSARPADEPAWAALRGAVHQMFAEHDFDPNRAVRTRLAKRHPSLLERQLARFAELERDLAERIAAREGRDPDDLRSRVLAASFLLALRLGSLRWIEEQQARSLAECMDAVMDEIARPFG
ncbi:TetR/AcrR family transcriptional regulator [Spirillospora sp. NPDC050679]